MNRDMLSRLLDELRHEAGEDQRPASGFLTDAEVHEAMVCANPHVRKAARLIAQRRNLDVVPESEFT